MGAKRFGSVSFWPEQPQTASRLLEFNPAADITGASQTAEEQ
jgi:hypothetical protein